MVERGLAVLSCQHFELKLTHREELGAASGTKRATSCVLVCATPQKRKDAKAPSAEDIAEWKEPLDECLDEVKKLEAVVQA
jgi:H/ACA ribonucleoprotein complex subunit 2